MDARGKNPYYRFDYVVHRIKQLLLELRLDKEIDLDVDQYNNTIKLYYESTEVWRDDIQTWDVWDEDEERWLNHG